MCSPSKVTLRARDDCLAAVPGTHDLGIVRDQERCDQARSAHCCGDRAEDEDARHLSVVLAWDCGHAVGDRETAAVVRDGFLADPRTDYVVSFGELYYPDGDTEPDKDNKGHEDHVHVTFKPSAADDDRPFDFGTSGGFGTMDDAAIKQEFANVTTRDKAISDAQTDDIVKAINDGTEKLHTQAQKHNEAARDRQNEQTKAIQDLTAAVRDLASKVDALARK